MNPGQRLFLVRPKARPRIQTLCMSEISANAHSRPPALGSWADASKVWFDLCNYGVPGVSGLLIPGIRQLSYVA